MNDEGITDAFYRDLTFGTGSLRGAIGAGTNRKNIFTVAKASRGLANYVNIHFSGEPSIAHDCRITVDHRQRKNFVEGVKFYE